MLRSFAFSLARECARAKEVFLDVLYRALHGDRVDREALDRPTAHSRNVRMIDDAHSSSVSYRDRRSTANGVLYEPFDERPANTVIEDRPNNSSILERALSDPENQKYDAYLASRFLSEDRALTRGTEVSEMPPLRSQRLTESAPTRSRLNDTTR